MKIIIEHARQVFPTESNAFWAGANQWFYGRSDYSDTYNLEGDSRRGYYAASVWFEDTEYVFYPLLSAEEKVHYMRCTQCGKLFDMRDFQQVAGHEHRGLEVEQYPSRRI